MFASKLRILMSALPAADGNADISLYNSSSHVEPKRVPRQDANLGFKKGRAEDRASAVDVRALLTFARDVESEVRVP